MFDAVLIEVDDPGCHVVFINSDLTNTTTGFQLNTLPLVHWPIGDIDAALGALGTARVAGTQVDALFPALVVF